MKIEKSLKIFKALILMCLILMFPKIYADSQIQYIDVHEAKTLHERGATFIDTRTWFERKLGMIDGALAMKKNQVPEAAPDILKDKDQPVVTYCAVGVRASDAADKLASLGYTNIFVISNGQGFSNWKKAGYPTNKK